jgi:glutathione S-transferase
MYKLYSRPMSGGFVVEAALTIAGAPFELIHVERKAPPAGFSDLSPFGKVPALGLPDGSTMTESAAICLLLAERFPDAGLGPAPGLPERPAFLRWMLFLATMLYPTLMQFYFAKRSTAELGGVDAVKQAAIREADRGFAILDEELAHRRWLVGSDRTIADVYLLMLAHWHPVGDCPRPEWTNIVALCERLKLEPAIASVNQGHRFW